MGVAVLGSVQHPISASVFPVSRDGSHGTSSLDGPDVLDVEVPEPRFEFDEASPFDPEIEFARAASPSGTSLDPTGVSSHRSFDDVERERWESGQEMSRKLFSVGCFSVAEKLRDCHSYWSVRQCVGCREALRFWNRCDLFWCPQCSPRLSKMRLDRLMVFVEQMKSVKHLVLTFRNVEVLTKDYLRSCLRSLQKFRRLKITRPVNSGLWAMEITNEGQGWHVHFHLVIESPWLDQRELSAAWRKCTPDESFIVHISDASRGSVRKNLPRYVTKYAGKGFRPHSWSAEKLKEFVRAVEGVRTFGVFGALHGKRKEISDWLRTIARERRRCQCGCNQFRYFSELEWLLETEVGRPESKPRPPPFADFNLELPLKLAFRWPDSGLN